MASKDTLQAKSVLNLLRKDDIPVYHDMLSISTLDTNFRTVTIN